MAQEEPRLTRPICMNPNQGTSSAKLHCPACQKPLISQVALAEGSRFVVMCAYCQRYTKIVAGFNSIEKRLLMEVRDTIIVTQVKE